VLRRCFEEKLKPGFSSIAFFSYFYLCNAWAWPAFAKIKTLKYGFCQYLICYACRQFILERGKGAERVELAIHAYCPDYCGPCFDSSGKANVQAKPGNSQEDNANNQLTKSKSLNSSFSSLFPSAFENVEQERPGGSPI
jgi:hypothetical protein